jgi:hypothetical protein
MSMLQDGLEDQWAYIYYWSYMVITYFLLLNALLAIIVEAYDQVRRVRCCEQRPTDTTAMASEFEAGLRAARATLLLAALTKPRATQSEHVQSI